MGKLRGGGFGRPAKIVKVLQLSTTAAASLSMVALLSTLPMKEIIK